MYCLLLQCVGQSYRKGRCHACGRMDTMYMYTVGTLIEVHIHVHVHVLPNLELCCHQHGYQMRVMREQGMLLGGYW